MKCLDLQSSFDFCFARIAFLSLLTFLLVSLAFGFPHGGANVFQPGQFHVLSAAGQWMLGIAANVGCPPLGPTSIQPSDNHFLIF